MMRSAKNLERKFDNVIKSEWNLNNFEHLTRIQKIQQGCKKFCEKNQPG